MEIYTGDQFHKTEFLVPIIKDLEMILRGSRETLEAAMGTNVARDPLCLFCRYLDSFGDGSIDELVVKIASRPFEGELGTAVLGAVESALRALDSLARYSNYDKSLDPQDDEILRAIQDHRDATGVIRRALLVWAGLCRHPAVNMLAGTDVTLLLLHSADAWADLEKVLKKRATSVVHSTTLVDGRFSDDQTEDYSLQYIAWFRDGWNEAFRTQLRDSLQRFCQRSFFVTDNGNPYLRDFK